jgi:HK97 gp10 family phage protein
MATIKGVGSLVKKLNALGGDSKQALSVGISQAVKKIQGDAKELCPGDTGQLRNSIYTSTEEQAEAVIGRVYTNNEHAAYVEFGTGPVGRMSPKDLPPEIASRIQYRADGWWIHESQIDAKTAEKYHFFRIETPQGVFYKTEGQPAQPYLYPAIKQNRENVKKIVADHMRNAIEKLVK